MNLLFEENFSIPENILENKEWKRETEKRKDEQFVLTC